MSSATLGDAEYLRSMLTAPVYDVVTESPIDHAPRLSHRLGHEVFIKREDLGPVHSFKLRGAYTKMCRLQPHERARGVIASSAGNHAQGVAFSAQRLGCRAVIVMPVTTPEVKVDAVRSYGAEVELFGESFSDAQARAADRAAAEGLTFVHPFDDPDVISGQGTVGMELLRQMPDVDAVFVAVGGGGLISGIATFYKQLAPEVTVIGVQTTDSDAMAQSLAAGELITVDDVGLFSDGTAVKQPGTETFRLASKYVDEIITVDTDEVCAAIKDVFEDTRAVLEPAGALAVAGLKVAARRDGYEGRQRWVAVATGANLNFDRLRFVSERAEIGEHREAVFAVTIPEERGSFRRFCEQVEGHPVTEFNYRIADADDAHVFVGLGVSGRDEAAEIADGLNAAGFATLNLTEDELAKLHLRHLVGGHSSLASDERVYRFEFPERRGALGQFLNAMAPAWNISLFHYRNHGADVGRVLVGMQVPPSDDEAFDAFLEGLGYRYTEETDNPAFKQFLG